MAFLAEYVPHDGVFYDSKAEKGVAKSLTMPDGQIVPGKHLVAVGGLSEMDLLWTSIVELTKHETNAPCKATNAHRPPS